MSSMRKSRRRSSSARRRDDARADVAEAVARSPRLDVGHRSVMRCGVAQVTQPRGMQAQHEQHGCRIWTSYAISNPALMSMSGSGVLKCGLPRVVGRSFARNWSNIDAGQKHGRGPFFCPTTGRYALFRGRTCASAGRISASMCSTCRRLEFAAYFKSEAGNRHSLSMPERYMLARHGNRARSRDHQSPFR